MTSTNGRTADHPIDPLFLDRWSPRSFSDEAIADAELFTLFEAARWAPSSSNLQPWRILYARRDDADWPLFLGCLNERNQSWAGGAAVLLALLSRRTTPVRGSDARRPSRSHSFDAGAAWACLALQARSRGWATHAIGGFDEARARDALGLDDDLRIECFIAVGRHAPHAGEPPPNNRNRQASFVRAGPIRSRADADPSQASRSTTATGRPT